MHKFTLTQCNTKQVSEANILAASRSFHQIEIKCVDHFEPYTRKGTSEIIHFADFKLESQRRLYGQLISIENLVLQNIFHSEHNSQGINTPLVIINALIKMYIFWLKGYQFFHLNCEYLRASRCDWVAATVFWRLRQNHEEILCRLSLFPLLFLFNRHAFFR